MRWEDNSSSRPCTWSLPGLQNTFGSVSVALWRSCRDGIPERESNEQTARPAIQETLTYLDIQRRADRATDAYQLDVAWLQLSTGVVVNTREVVLSNLSFNTIVIVCRKRVFLVGIYLSRRHLVHSRIAIVSAVVLERITSLPSVHDRSCAAVQRRKAVLIWGKLPECVVYIAGLGIDGFPGQGKRST